MKKITFLLLAGLALYNTGSAQTTTIFEAPPNNGGTSAFRAPNGTQDHAYMRSVFIINEREMLPLNMASISGMSFQVTGGTGSIPVTGNFTLYLSNTTDLDAQFAVPFATNFGPMTQVYAGPLTIPASAGAATFGVTFTNPFNYTGGSMYVGYSFEGTAPFAANTATYASNYQFASPYGNLTETGWLYNASSSVAPLPANAQVNSNFRPSILWEVTNTATNEVEVAHFHIPGVVSTFFNHNQTLSAEVVNSSTNTVNNLDVVIVGVGANPFNHTVTIPSLPGMSTQTVTFPTYSPQTVGVTDFTVAALLLDQNIQNNYKTWTQSVTCTSEGQHPANYQYNNGYGFTGPNSTAGEGIWSSRHNFPQSATLTGVNVAIANSPNLSTHQMQAMLLSATGSTLATGAPVALVPGSVVHFPFSTPQVLSANTDYFIGVFQPSANTQYFPIAYASLTTQVSAPYFTFGKNGGTPTPNSYYGYFGIEPVLTFPDLVLAASASTNQVCKTNTVPVVFTTTSTATSYSWSTQAGPISGAGNGPTVAITPTVPGTNGMAFYYVVGTHTSSGCQTNSAVISVSVAACASPTFVAIGEMSYATDIKLVPNPAQSGRTTISGLQGKNTIEVFGPLGQLIMREETSLESVDVNISQHAPGHYLIRISNENNEATTRKLINN